MTRLFVKNLPAYVNEERLRQHFAVKGEVTDAKIMRTRDGESRQFGFVGFRSDKEAQAAVKYFDRSFLDTSRLSCQIARAVGDPALGQPWSHRSQLLETLPAVKQPAHAAPTSKKKDVQQNVVVPDPQLKEFLDLMQPQKKRKLWGNDTLDGQEEDHSSLNGKREAKKKKTVEVQGQKAGKSAEHHEDGLKMQGADSGSEGDDDDVSDVAEEPEADKGSNQDYMKSRIKKAWNDDDDEEEEKEEEEEEQMEEDRGGESGKDHDASGEDGSELSSLQEHEGRLGKSADGTPNSRQVKSEIGEPDEVETTEVESSGRLFVRNLSYSTTEADLSELFSKYGELSEVHLVMDRVTQRSKGFAYVLFMLPEDAARAKSELDMGIFQGRLLHILPSRPPPTPLVTKTDLPEVPKPKAGRTAFQAERDLQRKSTELGGSTKAWSAFFMRADTVADNVAQKYGVSKSDLLAPDAADMAVRLALGETHVVADTKQALKAAMVDVTLLDALATGAGTGIARSNTTMLVKNLPFSAGESQLAPLFARFGELVRVVVPPTRTLALVEMGDSKAALRAFKGLAYKTIEHVPMYLEWAPEGIFLEPANPSAAQAKEQKETAEELEVSAPGSAKSVPAVLVGPDSVTRLVDPAADLAVPQDDGDDVDEARSVFVKNLSWSTTESGLRNHIEGKLATGSLRSVMIKKKKASNGKELSMGFGFLEFDSSASAKAACKQLQGFVVDGHALLLQLSRSTRTTPATRPKQAPSSTKVIVRNVAFQATRRDLQQLFSPFGQIKSLRLPKKFDGSHRGFAFLEFVTKQEAQNAMEALQNTHLYGRHLVLEQAREGEGLEELRARTAAQFEGKEPPGRKKKKATKDFDDTSQNFDDLAGL